MFGGKNGRVIKTIYRSSSRQRRPSNRHDLTIELVKNKRSREPYPWQERRSLHMYQYTLKRRVTAPNRQCHLFYATLRHYIEELNFMFDIAWQAIASATESFNFIAKY